MDSISKARAASGHAADATNETMTSVIWHHEVRSAAAKLGAYTTPAGREYMNSQTGRSRLSRGWANGEPVWMAAAAAAAFADGAAKAAEEDRTDDMNVLRRAWRQSKEA